MMGGRRRRRPVAPGAAPRDGDPAPRNGESGDDAASGIGGALLGGADLSQFDETADGDDVARALGMRANLLGDEGEAKARKLADARAAKRASDRRAKLAKAKANKPPPPP